MYLCISHSSHVCVSHIYFLTHPTQGSHIISVKIHIAFHTYGLKRCIWHFKAVLDMIWSNYRIYD